MPRNNESEPMEGVVGALTRVVPMMGPSAAAGLQIRQAPPIVPAVPGVPAIGGKSKMRTAVSAPPMQIAAAAVQAVAIFRSNKPFRPDRMTVVEAVGAGAAAGISSIRVFFGDQVYGANLNPHNVGSFAGTVVQNEIECNPIMPGEDIRVEITRTVAPGGVVAIDYAVTFFGETIA